MPAPALLTRIVTLLALALVTGARANVEQYTIKGVFTHSDVSGAIAAGDRFTLRFDLDGSAVDVNNDIEYGIFLNAVSNLSFSLDAGSTGNYGGGTMSASQFLSTTDNWSGYDYVNFYASPDFVPSGLNFAAASGNPFVELGFDLTSSNENTFNLGAISGETLGSVLPVLDLAAYDYFAQLHLVFGSWDDPQRAVADLTSISRTAASVPEGAPAGLAAVVLLVNGGLLAIAARNRRKSAA